MSSYARNSFETKQIELEQNKQIVSTIVSQEQSINHPSEIGNNNQNYLSIIQQHQQHDQVQPNQHPPKELPFQQQFSQQNQQQPLFQLIEIRYKTKPSYIYKETSRIKGHFFSITDQNPSQFDLQFGYVYQMSRNHYSNYNQYARQQ